MSLSGTFYSQYSRVEERLKKDPHLLIRTKHDVLSRLDRDLQNIGIKAVSVILGRGVCVCVDQGWLIILLMCDLLPFHRV